MTDVNTVEVIDDIEAYFNGDLKIDPDVLLGQALEALISTRGENSNTPSPSELAIGTKVRLSINPYAYSGQWVTGVISQISPLNEFPYIVDTEDGMTLWRAAHELEIL